VSRLLLSELAALVDGRLSGEDRAFDGVSTDTRTLTDGQLFVALRGPNFDGHDYLAEAAAKGAAGALVERGRATGIAGAVEVDDTRLALGRLARGWRQQCPATVIGLTGSNGKTTLKEMIAAVLTDNGSTLATRGNLNNDIGVPLTLCRLRDERYAVIEMGANHAGEIDYLTRLALPDVAILNNAGRAHLEGFGSLEGVAHAKAEIMRGLPEQGVFVFNADDRFADLWRGLAAGRRQRTFGVRQPADVSSPSDDYQVVWQGHRFEARFPVRCAQGTIDVGLRLAGEHNRMNALAAIAASLEAGAALDTVASALQRIEPVPGRLCPLVGPDGARLIDDSYNANPDSVIAALGVLQTAPGRRTLVLGDLAELGDAAADLHRQIGEWVAQAGVDRLLTVGQLSAAAGQAFTGEHEHFDSRDVLADRLAATLHEQDSVLVKGSRSARLDELVAVLRQAEAAC
jgi:UDP-N-acetylmuramoyl-tripeptide--D-alanyl-D-alanine ligase